MTKDQGDALIMTLYIVSVFGGVPAIWFISWAIAKRIGGKNE